MKHVIVAALAGIVSMVWTSNSVRAQTESSESEYRLGFRDAVRRGVEHLSEAAGLYETGNRLLLSHARNGSVRYVAPPPGFTVPIEV